MKELKKTYRDAKEKKSINNRLSIIQGQVVGIKKMIEEDRYCNDVLIQLQAIDKSIKSLANVLLETHMRDYVKSTIENKDEKSIDELMSLIKMFQ